MNTNNRRDFIRNSLVTLGSASLISSLPTSAFAESEKPRNPDKYPVAICMLSPEQISGPYFRNDKLIRRDITESEKGIPLLLNIKVVSPTNCKPVKGVFVDIWHCNSRGKYSGWTMVDPDEEAQTAEIASIPRTDERTFLRGAQQTDENGMVRFTTIYPGYYAGRATHVHVAIRKVSKDLSEKEHFAFVSQMYFPEEISAQVYQDDDYTNRRIMRVKNEQDELYIKMNGRYSLVSLVRLDNDDFRGGFTGEIILSIDENHISQYITKDKIYSYTV